MEWAPTAVLLLSLVSLCKSSSNETLHGLVGSGISIPFTKPLNTIEILCTFKGNKMLEWEKGKEETYFGNFRGRTKLTEGSIMIQNLQLFDSGAYELSFISEDGFNHLKNFNLLVLEPLSKPTINCTTNDTIIHLNCYFEDDSSFATIEWKHQNSSVKQADDFNLRLERNRLTILNPEESSSEYTCLVKHPGNQVQSDPFNINDCFTKGEGRGRVALAVAVICVLIVIIAAIIFVYWQWQENDNVQNKKEAPCKANSKNEPPQGDREETIQLSEAREEIA
ncbi:CD48 antigen-like [Pristis pectinata]|uniref:CD48 antigen-like n=1 Tax=Pristis pectinata TaxID=685728 RepID=UPI00223D3066|nr:CD48 antigen-like [Pristis pectinata]